MQLHVILLDSKKKIAVKSTVLFHNLQVSLVVQLSSKKFVHLAVLLLIVRLYGDTFGKNAPFVITALKTIGLCCCSHHHSDCYCVCIMYSKKKKNKFSLRLYC